MVSDVWASRCPSVATPTAPGKDLSEEEICKRLADVRSRERGDLSKITWEALGLRDAIGSLTHIRRQVVGLALSPAARRRNRWNCELP